MNRIFVPDYFLAQAKGSVKNNGFASGFPTNCCSVLQCLLEIASPLTLHYKCEPYSIHPLTYVSHSANQLDAVISDPFRYDKRRPQP